jgi:hypothetical protein
MSYVDEAQLELEARQLLARQRNKTVVINYYINRGMAPEQAGELIESIYRTNLTSNRGDAMKWLGGGGAGVVISIIGLFLGGWVTLFSLLALPVCLLILIIGIGRFWVAKGYEMDAENE